MPRFSYDHIVRTVGSIDVAWFNQRMLPASLFEIEHSTAINNSLLKFVELQDFNTTFCIVADALRKKEFEERLRLEAFRRISKRVQFWSYENLAKLHSLHSKMREITARI